MEKVDYKTLQEKVKALNEACGTTIKVISVKREALEKAFTDAMENGLDGVPEDISAFYQENFKGEGVEVAASDEVEPAVDEVATVTEFGNSMEKLVVLAESLEFEVEDGFPIESLEAGLLSTLDKLSEDA